METRLTFPAADSVADDVALALTIMMADDAIAGRGVANEASVVALSGKTFITTFMSMLASETWNPCKSVEDARMCTADVKHAFSTMSAAKRKDGRAILAKAGTWPPSTHVKGVESGEFAKIDECFHDRPTLGTCTVSDRSAAISWQITRQYYDVASVLDSDAGLKACLGIGGSWKAIPRDSPEAIEARLHQHGAQLNRLLQ